MATTVLQLGVHKINLETSLKANPDVQFYAFDPYPYSKGDLQYDNLHFYQQAAWIKNETKTLGSYGKNGSGATLLPTKRRRTCQDNDNTSWPGYSRLYEVECIDLGEWVKNNLSQNDDNIIIMDIEGSEYYVIPHLIETDVMTYFKALYFEGHYQKMNDRSKMFEIHLNIIKWCAENNIVVDGMKEIF